MITQQVFLKYMQEKAYFKNHHNILVAVSGGIDSLNLLSFLYHLQKELGIQLAVAHVNYQQRKESEDEENYLRTLAHLMAVPFFSTRFTGVFSEKNAREARYNFFKRIMEQEQYTALVTAHHANDQAETIFMRILRGSRLRHIVGIQDRQPFGSGELIRPFLSFKKIDLPPIFHFEDRSNQLDSYLRNRVRNHYLPELESENPRFSSALCSLAGEVNHLYQALTSLTEQIEIRDLSQFLSFSPSLQMFLLEEYISRFPDLQLKKAQFEQILHILRTKANYEHYLKDGYILSKDYETFEIKKEVPKIPVLEKPILLKENQEIDIKTYHISFNIALDGATCLYLNSKSPILLRYRQPSDRLLINGVSKKVSRYFIDQKIPQKEREDAIVLEQEGVVLGILGMVVSDLSKMKKNGIMKSKLYIK